MLLPMSGRKCYAFRRSNSNVDAHLTSLLGDLDTDTGSLTRCTLDLEFASKACQTLLHRMQSKMSQSSYRRIPSGQLPSYAFSGKTGHLVAGTGI